MTEAGAPALETTDLLCAVAACIDPVVLVAALTVHDDEPGPADDETVRLVIPLCARHAGLVEAHDSQSFAWQPDPVVRRPDPPGH